MNVNIYHLITIIVLCLAITGGVLSMSGVSIAQADNTTTSTPTETSDNNTTNTTETETSTPDETETPQNQTETGDNGANNTNESQTTTDNNTPEESVNEYDFGGNVDSAGSEGASTQNMYVNSTHHPNASTDELSGTVVAGSSAGDVYLVNEKYPSSGAELHLYSERNVTVTISWNTGDNRGEAKKVDLKKGLNVVTINAGGSSGSITVPVPDRPTDEIYQLNKGLSLDGLVGVITIKHVIGTAGVVITGIPFVLFWLSNWFRRNVFEAYHMLGSSNLVKLFKP